MNGRFASGSTRARGDKTEALVLSCLGEHGLVFVERNVELGGVEVDLVARSDDGETVVFIEVRGRSNDAHGSPAQTVNTRKQRQVIRGATTWLVKAGLWEQVAVRFDVVGVTAGQGDAPPTIEWIENAFDGG